jgi:uncharacterized protein YndB with AHSA1/START domain
MSGSKFDLEITRVVKAPPALVWKAWTQAEHLEKWWAPKPLTTKVIDLVLRPGGAFASVMTAPDGTEYPGRGVFLDVVKNERIVFTDALEPGWRPAQAPFFTAIIAIEPVKGGVRYTARALHKNEEDRKKHEDMGFHEGWGKCIGQLAELAEGWAKQ